MKRANMVVVTLSECRQETREGIVRYVTAVVEIVGGMLTAVVLVLRAGILVVAWHERRHRHANEEAHLR